MTITSRLDVAAAASSSSSSSASASEKINPPQTRKVCASFVISLREFDDTTLIVVPYRQYPSSFASFCFVLFLVFSLGYVSSCATNQLYQIHLNLCNERNVKTKTTKKNTVSPIITGSDSGEHGCSSSTGYSWCANLNKCINPFEDGINCEVPGCWMDDTYNCLSIYEIPDCKPNEIHCKDWRHGYCYCNPKYCGVTEDCVVPPGLDHAICRHNKCQQ